jgi:excisionase family DNA binding protein
MEVEQVQVFPKLLTAQDVAKILSVPLSTLHHWAVRGEGPPSFKVGKHRRFDAAVVAAWLEKQQQDVA